MSTFSNVFSSKLTRQIEAKLHMEPPWDWRTIIYLNGPSHMTKVAAMPIYGKNLKNIFSSGTKRPMTWTLRMQHQVLEYYQVCSKDYPESTLTYFTAMSNLVPYAFVWEKGKQWIFQNLLSPMV